MESKVKENVKTILATIVDARKYSNPYNPAQLFSIAESLIAGLAYLISPLFDAETAYRQEVKEYIANEKSVAGAEAEAKAGENYQEWQKLKYVYGLAEEQIRLIKKFSHELSGESMRN